MKKFFFFLSLVALVSCSDKSQVNQSTISGTVLNNPTGFLILMTQSRSADTIFLNEDGSFSFVKQLEKPGSYYLQVTKKVVNLFLEPGKDLDISFDANDFDATITFAGDLAAENNYYREITAYNSEAGRMNRDQYLAEPEEYFALITEQRQAKEKLLNGFVEANPGMSQYFVNNEGMGYEFGYYSALLNYEPAHKYYAKVEELELPEDWYSFMNNIDINNPAYLDNPVSMNVVASIVDRNINESSDLGDDAWGTAELLGSQFDWVKANITDPVVSEYFLNSFISSIVDYQGPAGIEEYVSLYLESSTNDDNKKVMQDKITEWAPLNPGEVAPGFTLPDINGNEVSLTDFAGKYVYIDFWATWCGPCKVEIPVLEQLASEYKDKNLVIVSISVDKDKQAWVDMLTRDKPEWLQLHDSVNMNDNYLVKYIPTFVLLDREGKILNPRAPMPSSGEVLTSLFNSLEGL